MRIAVTFTIENSTYTDLWKKYYGKFFDKLELVDTGELLKHDWGATTKLLNDMQEELLRDYDLILFADVDEIIVPDPDVYKDLGEYLDRMSQPSARCTGYNVVEMDGDADLDLSKPILSQRSMWSRDEMYDKTIAITKPTVYLNNHHTAGEVAPDPNLVMLHLRDADIKRAKERLKTLGRELNVGDLTYRRSIAKLIPEKWRII